MYCCGMFRVGARECGCAIRVSRTCTTCTSSRTSTIRSFAGKVLFKVRAHLPLVRESVVARDLVACDSKRTEKCVARTKRAIMFVLETNC